MKTYNLIVDGMETNHIFKVKFNKSKNLKGIATLYQSLINNDINIFEFLPKGNMLYFVNSDNEFFSVINGYFIYEYKNNMRIIII